MRLRWRGPNERIGIHDQLADGWAPNKVGEWFEVGGIDVFGKSGGMLITECSNVRVNPSLREASRRVWQNVAVPQGFIGHESDTLEGFPELNLRECVVLIGAYRPSREPTIHASEISEDRKSVV